MHNTTSAKQLPINSSRNRVQLIKFRPKERAKFVMIKGYIGSGKRVLKALVNYGIEYATLTHADFELFKKAIQERWVKKAA